MNKSGYLQALAGSGGTAPYSFTVTAGALPNGLALSAAGVLSGTPTVASTVNFTVKAPDSLAATGTQAYVVTINPVVAIAPASLPNWTVNKSGYSQTITAANGTGAKTLVISSGTLPPGLTFTPATGVLAGTPTATGPFSFTIKATDSVGATGTQIYSVTINAAVGVTPASLPDFEVESRLREGKSATDWKRPAGGEGLGIPLSEALVRFERETIQTALARHLGSLEGAAVELGLPISNLRYKMSRLDLPLDGAVDADPI